MAKSLTAIFAENVRAERARQSLSQSELAALLESSQPYLSKIEQEKLSPTLEAVEKICKALGVDSAHLLREQSLSNSTRPLSNTAAPTKAA